jgi:hypothetical protein
MFSPGVVTVLMVVAVVAVIFLFFGGIHKHIASIMQKISVKIGAHSATQEYALQRYVFLHGSSPIAKFYGWINEQVVASGLKRNGVTPYGFTLFWVIVSMITSVVFGRLFALTVFMNILIFFVMCIVFFVLVRIKVTGAMEKRELAVMDAMDLIIPELHNGVKNAITRYCDNFDPCIRYDFKVFLTNIQERGVSFEEAMTMLADNLGFIFKDFAQKAIFFENIGDPEQKIIFDDIVEQNRLRRELRATNNRKLGELKIAFAASSGIVIFYFWFMVLSDTFSRHFFLYTDFGIFLLILSATIIFSVLAYIYSLQSRTL